MGVRAAQESDLELAWLAQVAQIASAAAQQTGIVDSSDAADHRSENS
jgi:hypothetical protein